MLAATLLGMGEEGSVLHCIVRVEFASVGPPAFEILSDLGDLASHVGACPEFVYLTGRTHVKRVSVAPKIEPCKHVQAV